MAMRRAFFARMFCAAIGALVPLGVTPSAFAAPDPTTTVEPVEVFYITNRAPESAQDGTLTYGAERSHSLAFGVVPVFGHEAVSVVKGDNSGEICCISRSHPMNPW